MSPSIDKMSTKIEEGKTIKADERIPTWHDQRGEGEA